MIAHFTMRTHEVNQAFRFVEGIWLHRKRRQILNYFGKDRDTIVSFGKDLFY